MADRKNNETTSWNADEVRRQQTQRKQRKKMRRTRFWAIYCAGVVLGSCLLAGLGWLIVNDVCALNKAPLTATVEIEKGDSVGQIASKLKKAGIIKYKLLFVITSPLFHAKDTIQPGSYELNTDMDYNCIIDSMQQGSSVAGTVKVTIPEGYSVQETIQLLADSDVSNVEDLTEAAKNHVFDYTFVDTENLGSPHSDNRVSGKITVDLNGKKCSGYDQIPSTKGVIITVNPVNEDCNTVSQYNF